RSSDSNTCPVTSALRSGSMERCRAGLSARTNGPAPTVATSKRRTRGRMLDRRQLSDAGESGSSPEKSAHGDHRRRDLPRKKRRAHAEQEAELVVESAAHDEVKDTEKAERNGGADRPLGGALDDERTPNEAIGCSDELQDFDLDPAAVKGQA